MTNRQMSDPQDPALRAENEQVPSAQAFIPPSKRRRIACSECRQSKVKCDASQGPCSRCRRLQLKCETVVGYKRVDRKSKMEEIENELQHLKSMVGQNERPLSSKDHQIMNGTTEMPTSLHDQAMRTPSTPNYINQSQMSIVDQGGLQRNDQHCVNGASNLERGSYVRSQLVSSPPISNTASGPRTPRNAASASRSIGSIRLNEAQINHLFQIFFDSYHPFLPFLDPSNSPDEHHDGSPLLFWSIISVASRRYREDPALLMSLSKPVTQLAWETISEPPLLRVGIQALLLLCSWPFPSLNVMKADPSLHLVTIAINSAMQLGLHRPEFTREFGITRLRINRRSLTEPEKREATKIWAACNIIAQDVIGHFGHPPPVALFDWTIDRACEIGTNHTLPDEIRIHLIMQRICYRVTKAMSGNASNPTALPPDNERYIILNLLETDIDTAEGQFGKHVSMINQLYIWAARVYLHIFYFFDSSLSEARRLGILKAYSAASTLTAKISAGDTLFDMLETSPSSIFRMLFTTSAVLLKVLNSTYVRYVDLEAGKQMFNTAINGLRRLSIRDNDKGFRAAEMLTQMWSMYSEMNNRKPEEPSLRFKCRLGTSLIYDLLWHWREEMTARGQVIPQLQGVVSATNEIGVDRKAPAQTPAFSPPADLLTGSAVPAELDPSQGPLGAPWDDLDAIAFDWDWELDLHGFTLPT